MPRRRGVTDAATSPFVMGIAKDGRRDFRENGENREMGEMIETIELQLRTIGVKEESFPKRRKKR